MAADAGIRGQPHPEREEEMIVPIEDPNVRPEILDRVEAEGFAVFDSGADFDLNIIGERNPAGEDDNFDDWLHVIYKEGGEWRWHAYRVTTDPGIYWLRRGEDRGTAILCHPQQMRGVYKLDLHSGKYLALCQRNGEVKVWRDRNGDDHADLGGNVHEGYFGINIHRSSIRGSDRVGPYSAGCTVFSDPDDFNEFIQLCKEQERINDWSTYTYTLIGGK